MEKKEYQILIKTNCYAGNFERQMCAFITAKVGECEVGSEIINNFMKEEHELLDVFDGIVGYKPDEHGCWRPVALDEENINNFIIFLDDKLSPELLSLVDERAKLFEKIRPYKYLHEDFKYLGCEQIEVTTTKTRIKI